MENRRGGPSAFLHEFHCLPRFNISNPSEDSVIQRFKCIVILFWDLGGIPFMQGAWNANASSDGRGGGCDV